MLNINAFEAKAHEIRIFKKMSKFPPFCSFNVANIKTVYMNIVCDHHYVRNLVLV